MTQPGPIGSSLLMLALGPQTLAQLWGADSMAGKTKGEGCHFGAVIMGPMQVGRNKKAVCQGEEILIGCGGREEGWRKCLMIF